MLSAINHNTHVHFQATENDAAPQSPLIERCSPKWETVLYVAKVALIITGIAMAVFMKIPTAVLALSTYGIVDILLHIAMAKSINKQYVEKSEQLKEERAALEESIASRRKKYEDLRIQTRAARKDLPAKDWSALWKKEIRSFIASAYKANEITEDVARKLAQRADVLA